MFTRNSIVLSNNIKTPLTAISKAIGNTMYTSVEYLARLIKPLFANNEQGFAYDPNDLTTLYQDAAGTIPVTAAGQPVGLMLDKSGRNNHAFQTVSASRPILQQTPILGNELVVNGNFNNGLDGWERNDTVTLNRDTSIFNNGGAKITVNAAEYTHFYTNLGSNFVVGKRYIASADVYTPSTNTVDVVAAIGFVMSSLMIKTVMQKNTNIVEKISMEFVATSTTHSLYCSVAKKDASVWGAVGDVAYFDNVSVKEITGYRSDQNYLKFDGADDFLVTNSIDFTATDKVSLFVGVTSLIDTAGIISELSADSNINHGAFTLSSVVSGGILGYTALSRGTATVASAQGANSAYYPSPNTAILSIKHNISGDLSSMRRNGVIGIDGVGDKGAGNFGNYPLFIGRRQGTIYPFNGHIYSLIGIGRLTADSETTALEKAIAKNTGVTLNV